MRPHRTDMVSLTFALVFFGVVAVWFATTIADVQLPRAGWIVAVALIFFGIVGLVGTWRVSRTRGDRHPDGD